MHAQCNTFKTCSQSERVVFVVAMFSISRFDFQYIFVIVIRYLCITIHYLCRALVCFLLIKYWIFLLLLFLFRCCPRFRCDLYFGIMANRNQIDVCSVQRAMYTWEFQKICTRILWTNDFSKTTLLFMNNSKQHITFGANTKR